MKTIQKFEIIAGIATLLSAFAYFWENILPFAKYESENSGTLISRNILAQGFLLLIVPGILAGGGAWFWATRGSRPGFVAVVTGASVLTLFFGANLYTGMLFNYSGFLGVLAIFLPFGFTVLTLVFAFRCRIIFHPRNKTPN